MEDTKTSPLENSAYTVGWICALPLEMGAAIAMLDEEHGKPQSRDPWDLNSYHLGRVGVHNVVITCLPSGVYGTVSAAKVGDRMRGSFESIRVGLLVGIGGGVPSDDHDIRLGDVVVSQPENIYGGVIQYDFGKTLSLNSFQRTGSLGKPPEALLTAVSSLRGLHYVKDNLLSAFIEHMNDPRKQFSCPGANRDVLFESDYKHDVKNKTCKSCDSERTVNREPRANSHPVIHYGLIASADKVVKDGDTRDRLGKELDVLCFEMEAAGLMDCLPSLVIRGICDYADSHKNKRWQPYAAAAAAAYAKELLYHIPKDKVAKTQKAFSDSPERGRERPPSYDQAVQDSNSKGKPQSPSPTSTEGVPATPDRAKARPQPPEMNITIKLSNALNDSVRSRVTSTYPNGMLGYVPITEVDALDRGQIKELDYHLLLMKKYHSLVDQEGVNKEFRHKFKTRIAPLFSPYPAGNGQGLPGLLTQIARNTGKDVEDLQWEIGGLGMWAIDTYFALCRYRGILSFNKFKWLR